MTKLSRKAVAEQVTKVGVWNGNGTAVRKILGNGYGTMKSADLCNILILVKSLLAQIVINIFTVQEIT